MPNPHSQSYHTDGSLHPLVALHHSRGKPDENSSWHELRLVSDRDGEVIESLLVSAQDEEETIRTVRNVEVVRDGKCLAFHRPLVSLLGGKKLIVATQPSLIRNASCASSSGFANLTRAITP